MPRRPRLDLPGLPMHVTQRGVNRCAIFIDDDDRLHFLRLLRSACRRHAVLVHAFALMDNHVHLLVTASKAGAISAAMRRSGQFYVQAFNTRHGRTGTLWQSRFKSCLVDSDRYLLTVLRYIDLNPVRAALVASPEEYPWSSARFHLGLRNDRWLTPCDAYVSLGPTLAERARRYLECLHEALDDDELNRIRRHASQQRALGSPCFQAMVEKALNRPVALRGPGRPRTRLDKE